MKAGRSLLADGQFLARRHGIAWGLVLGLTGLGLLRGTAVGVQGLAATGQDSRIDLQWGPPPDQPKARYTVYRSRNEAGPFLPLNEYPHGTCLYSDFIGQNGEKYFYRVAPVPRSTNEEQAVSATVSARPKKMKDQELLTSVQAATFRYFWDWAHPVSGLIRERSDSEDVCAAGGTGFGLFALMVGAERGFAERARVAERVRGLLAFLEDRTMRYHGAFPHWIHGGTGKTVPFSPLDNGADLVETALLMQGVLAVRQYFNHDDPVENEIRRRATQLWEAVEWNWFLKNPGGKKLQWHWSPNHGFDLNVEVAGYNESMIAYLLAVASPTHPIPPDCYYRGWAAYSSYAHNKDYYEIRQYVGKFPLGGPLFMTQYSFIGFDPRDKRDRFCNYFENSRNTSLIHWAYALENPAMHQGYGEDLWGLTASTAPDGYYGNAPGKDDLGTIAPTAALSAMPFTPNQSLACLKNLYHHYGKKLWGEFGFKDAFNLDRNWYADVWLAIDQGPIIAMIENYRTGLCWRMFMANPEIAPMLKAIGWQTGGTTPTGTPPPVVKAPTFHDAPPRVRGTTPVP